MRYNREQLLELERMRKRQRKEQLKLRKKSLEKAVLIETAITLWRSKNESKN